MININEVELSRQILSENLSLNPSPRRKVYLLNNYFTYLLNLDNIQIFEAFGSEFLEIYVKAWGQYDPVGVNPSFSNSMIFICEGLLNEGVMENYSSLLMTHLAKQKLQLEKLDNSLQGLVSDRKVESNLNFPVLEGKIGDEIISGYIEEIEIIISEIKGSNKNIFILVHGGMGGEEKLKKQIDISWNFAKKYSGNYVKNVNKAHKVIINFSRETALYVGDSMGIALTLKFIESLLKYYNSRWIITFPKNKSFSGSVNENGEIGILGDENIRHKVETLFFSCELTMVIPEKEVHSATDKLIELKSIYPKRVLKIWGINSIDEILNRRDLVDIRPQKIQLLIKNSLKRQPMIFSFIALTLALMILISSLLREFDQNPAVLENIPYELLVKNQYGRILFTKSIAFNINDIWRSSFPKSTQLLVDINGDGINELVLAYEKKGSQNPVVGIGQSACYDNFGELLDIIEFEDSVIVFDQIQRGNFQVIIGDTVREDGKLILYCIGNNIPEFASAIFKYDLLNKKRVGPVLWNPGHLHNLIIGDFDRDGDLELVSTGLNNGYERATIFSLDLEKLTKTCAIPSISEYSFTNLELAQMNHYVLLPKSDYTKYLNLRFNNVPIGSLSFHHINNKFNFTTLEGHNQSEIGGTVNYWISGDFRNIDVFISDALPLVRDPLVKSGKLKGPLTNTREYSKLLKDQIMYWDGTGFVNQFPH